jgi:hypothetical protein
MDEKVATVDHGPIFDGPTCRIDNVISWVISPSVENSNKYISTDCPKSKTTHEGKSPVLPDSAEFHISVQFVLLPLHGKILYTESTTTSPLKEEIMGHGGVGVGVGSGVGDAKGVNSGDGIIRLQLQSNGINISPE